MLPMFDVHIGRSLVRGRRWLSCYFCSVTSMLLSLLFYFQESTYLKHTFQSVSRNAVFFIRS